MNCSLTLRLSFKSDNKEKTLTSLEKVCPPSHARTAAAAITTATAIASAYFVCAMPYVPEWNIF
jgi:hypothetical protein